MAAERAYHLPSASQRPRWSNSESKGLRTRAANGIVLHPRTGNELGWPSSNTEAREEGRVPPSSSFCPIWALSGWDDVHACWGGPPTLSGPLVQVLTSPETPSSRNRV